MHEKFLIGGYYYFMIALFSIFFIFGAYFKIKERKNIFGLSRKTWFLLILIIAAAGITRYFFGSFCPQVFNDEFLYLGTAENMAKTHLSIPLLEKGFPPQGAAISGFLPPYPQGWPVLISLVFAATGSAAFNPASYLSFALSIITVIPIFFSVYFLFKNESGNNDLAETCGLFAALMWAVLPVHLKMTGSSSPEIASTLFIAVFFALLFYNYRFPSPLSLFLTAVSLAIVVNMRPENIFYIFFTIPLFINYKKNFKNIFASAVSFFVLVIYSILPAAIMQAGRMNPELHEIFTPVPRSGFPDVFSNFTANVINNFKFLFGYNGINPVIITILFIAGLAFLIASKPSRKTGYALLIWPLFFLIILSVFPFGDFASVYSFDSFRFALHIYFPIIISASYGAYKLSDYAKSLKIKNAVIITIAIIIGLSPFIHTNFIRKTRPEVFYFFSLNQMLQNLPENSIIISEKSDEALLIHFGGKIPVFLVKDKNDLNNFNTGKNNVFTILKGVPSDFIMENFNFNVHSRQQVNEEEYIILQIENMI